MVVVVESDHADRSGERFHRSFVSTVTCFKTNLDKKSNKRKILHLYNDLNDEILGYLALFNRHRIGQYTPAAEPALRANDGELDICLIIII